MKPNSSAFPYATNDPLSGLITVNPGMSIRTWLAGIAMQGLLANRGEMAQSNNWPEFKKAFAKDAVQLADALLTELNEGTND